MNGDALKPKTYRYAGVVPLVQSALLLAGCDGAAPAAPNESVAAVPPPTLTNIGEGAPAPQGDERLVLAFGDSLYAGYRLNRGESLADAVQTRLRQAGVNARVVNAGVSGDTTAAGRHRFVFSLDNLPRKPDLVLLGLGGNDVLRQLPVAETRANMTAMLEELKRRGIPAVLTGMMAPPNLGPEYAVAFNAIWPELSERYHAPLYPFILDGVIGNTALMLPDRVHPNARGVERIADRVTPLVEKALSAK